MSLDYRLASLACLVCWLVVLTPQAGSAADVPAKTAVSVGQAQRREPSTFSELQRRAAAQEGLSKRDKTFLMTAAQSQMLQLDVSRVAMERSNNPDVRHFARATVQFIGGAKKHLDNIASEFGMSLPQIPPEQVQNARLALDKAPDPDREYLLGILSDTTRISTLYKDEASNGKNPVLSQYAQELLPQLRRHYRNAHNLLAGS